MASEDNNFSVWGFIKGFGKFVIGSLLVIQGIVGLFLLLFIVGAMTSFSQGFVGGKSNNGVTIEADSALLINPNGILVEQAETVDPFEQAIQDAYGVDEPSQIEVHDIVRVLREDT